MAEWFICASIAFGIPKRNRGRVAGTPNLGRTSFLFQFTN